MTAWQTALRALLIVALFAPAVRAEDATTGEQAAQAAVTEPAAPPATVPGSGEGAADDGAGDGAPPTQIVWMGTGSVTGVYFPVGVALCRLANQHRRETGLRCAAKPTSGSIENIGELRQGAFAFGLAQSDAQAEAVAGTGAFASTGADGGLRSVMSLYPEALTLVVRADAGVARVEDLAGKRVALGQAGAGTRTLADALLAALGWTPASFGATPDIPAERLGQALCGGEIDGFFYAVGQPARLIQEATTGCDARLVPIAGAAVEALVASRPYYVPATIPGGLYRGTPGPVATFGVEATLVTEAAVPDATVRAVAGAILDDVDMLRGLDPVLAQLDPKTMVQEGLSAPLHPAAQALYRERGLLK